MAGNQRWVVPFGVILAIAAPIGFFYYLQSRPVDSDRWLASRIAANNKVDPETVYSHLRVAHKIGAHQPISESEWQVFEEASRSDNPMFRMDALEGVVTLQETPYADRARALTKRLARDSDVYVSMDALIMLMRMKDPEAAGLLRVAKQSPSKYVRTKAVELEGKFLAHAGPFEDKAVPKEKSPSNGES